MKPEQTKPTVTIEELLRLKRAERPSEEFWTRFEKELHTKQLAACIEPRPWWLGLSLAWRKAMPLALPASAVAALALSIVGVQRIAFHATPSSASAPVVAAASIPPVHDSASATAATARSVIPVAATPAPAPSAVIAKTSSPAPVIEIVKTSSTPPGGGDGHLETLEVAQPEQATAVAGAHLPPASQTIAATAPAAPAAISRATSLDTPVASLVALTPPPAKTGFVISPGGQALSLSPGSAWLADPSQHETEQLVTLLPLASHLASHALPLSSSLMGDSLTGPASSPATDNTLAAIRGNDRLARLVSFSPESESYVTTGETTPADAPHRVLQRRVNDDDVLPAAVRRLVGGGDRVSFRF